MSKGMGIKNVNLIFIGIFICLVGFLMISVTVFFVFSPKDEDAVEEPLSEVESSVEEVELNKMEIDESGVKITMDIKDKKDVIEKIVLPEVVIKESGVLWIDRRNKDLHIIDIGSQASVKEGMIFEVFRDATIVGRVQVKEVKEFYSIVELISPKRLEGEYFTISLSGSEARQAKG